MPNPHHPDLRPVIADAINELMQTREFQPTQPQKPVTLEQINVLRQRTIQNVETLNSKLNGGDLAATLALVTQEAVAYPWLFVTCRRLDEDDWQPVGSVSGAGGEHGTHQFLGKSRGPRSFICIGSLNVIPDGGSIRIELPDGTEHEEHAEEGCCVILAPITFPPDTGEPTTIYYRHPDGSEIRSERL